MTAWALALVTAVVPANAAATPDVWPDHVRDLPADQPVVYSEQQGIAGAAGAAKVKTCRALCPSAARAEPCRVEGDVDRDGRFIAHTWRRADASVRLVESWALAGVDGNVCHLRLQRLRTLRITRFDGRQTTFEDVDLDRREGRRRVTAGRSPALAVSSEAGVDALKRAGYAPAGTATHAGYTCRLLRKVSGDVEQSTCLLDDARAPASVHGVAVQMTPLAEATITGPAREQRTESALVRIDWNVTVPAALFAPPPDIRWKGAP